MIHPVATEAATARPSPGRVRRRPAEEVRQRRQRAFSWALWAILGILLINALVGEDGYLAAIRVQQEEAALTSELAQVRLDSWRLQQERERLDKDPAAVEEAARRLGMIRDGEIVATVRNAEPPVSLTPSR